MSTYTDLHNRIKENLTILRKPGSDDDGMTPQKVIFINPENQFYGTFNGKMNITGGILSGLKIIDSELEGVKLDDASVDGVSLRELKTTVDVNTQDIEQLQKDKEAISAAHDALSVGLSGVVDNLSVAVNKKLDTAVEEVKKSISGVVGDATTLSIGLGKLNSKIETLSSGMLNGVVYKGQLVLHRDHYTLPRQLFNDDPACCLLEGTQAPLKNGWMWRVSLDRENVGGDYVHISDPNTSRELDLGKGDYIIIKNHLTGLYEVVPDDQMRMDDFDVINAQDEDDTKLAVLKQVSAETLVSAKVYTDEASAYALAESIKYTNSVSSKIFSITNAKLTALSNDLTSYSNKLCSDLSTQVDAEFVHKSGDTIANLSVTGQLSVSGKTTLEDEVSINARNHSTIEVLEGGISAKTDGSVAISANEKIELKSKAPIDVSGSRFTGVFTNGVKISSTKGLDDFVVNGKTIQSSLVELSTELTSWTHAQDLKLSNEVDRKRDALSTSLSTTVNNEFVHLSGDKISWIDVEKLSAVDAKVKQLNALSIASRRLSVDSTNDIELKTGSSIILSAASGIHTNVGLDKVVLAGTSLQSTMHNVSSYLNINKLDIESASRLSTKICSDVVGSGYLKAISVDFKYDNHDKTINLSAGSQVYKISADDFIKDGMLESVKYDPVGDDIHSNPPYIVLSFNTDAGKDDIWLRVKELVDVYKASEDGITLSDNIFSLNYSQIKENTGLNALSDDLYGTPGDPGTLGRLEDLQNQIDVISTDNFGVLSFTGHLVPDLNATTSYSSIGAFLQSTRGEDQHQNTSKVKNGASFNIYFKEKDLNNSKMISVDNAGSTLLLGNGDVLVVHDHSNSEYVALSDLLVATDENPISGGNVYILKAGVSRYEFEAEAKKHEDDDAFISAWIKRNFANTEAKSYVLTTTLKQDVSADGNLSVANDAVVGRNFNALSNTFRVEVNNQIPANPENWIVGSAEYIDFNINADDGAQLRLEGNSIDLSAQHIQFNDVLSVETETSSTIATILSAGILSSDALTSRALSAGDLTANALTTRVADISERLSATNAYIDLLSATEAKIIGVEVENSLSIKTFSNLVAEDTSSSIADLCVGLSVGIKNLSTNLSRDIGNLSADLSSNISTLTSQMNLALSALDRDPLSSLSVNSKISAVVDAVLDIRDTLSALRSILRI